MTARSKKAASKPTNKSPFALGPGPGSLTTEEVTKEAQEREAQKIVESAKSGGNIFDRATLIVLNFEGVGNSRKVRTAQLEPQADFSDTVVGANKKLFKCEEFLAIKRNEADTRQFIGRKALPSYFQRGTYLVPNKSIPAVVEKLREIKADRDNMLVPNFIARYDEIVKENMKLQGDLANPTDYESRDVVRSKYARAWHFVPFTVAGENEGISAQLAKEERQKARATWTAAANEMTLMLRASMQELVDHMLDRLSGGEDGKPQMFRAGMTAKMMEFLDDFEDRNITNDTELSALVVDAKKLLEGVDDKELRASNRTRKQIVEGLSVVKKTLDTMLEERPDRAFSFENI